MYMVYKKILNNKYFSYHTSGISSNIINLYESVMIKRNKMILSLELIKFIV